ncbi:MAG: universal stress protein [Cytophagales bacterium]|nr:universal stress protein [Cytophagales bacterium]
MKKILVPSDLSDISENALTLAVDIANKMQADIYLVNFVDHPYGKSFTASGDADAKYGDEQNLFTIQLIRKNHERLGNMADRAALDSNEIYYEVFDEDFEEGINIYVEEKGIDLIVMGTTGEETLEEFFTGNHTEQVIQQVNCPVISVKERYHPVGFDHIVLGIDLKQDGKDDFAKAFAYINALSTGLGAKMDVVHVADPSSKNHDVLKDQLVDFSQRHGLLNYNVTVTENRDKERGLIAFAHAKGASLLAVLTHVEGGFFRVFSHSTSEEITKESDIPVLTINLHNI